jgi:hypothetical protein
MSIQVWSDVKYISCSAIVHGHVVIICNYSSTISIITDEYDYKES